MFGRVAKFVPVSLIPKNIHAFLRKRGAPLYLAVGVHAEKIQDEVTYRSLLDFVKRLPCRPAVFVMTPESPIVDREMRREGIRRDVFSGRLGKLAEFCEIGLHGHYCRPLRRQVPGQSGGWLSQAGFELASHDAGQVTAQFKAEYAYLAAAGFRPRTYCGGWWIMNSTIAGLLGAYGFTVDCSLRYKCGDTFGARYIDRKSWPARGRPFLLPPGRTVSEIPSAVYLHERPGRLLVEILPFLKGSSSPLFAVLPVHDYSLPERAADIIENIRLLSAISNVRFKPLGEMASLAGVRP